MRISLTEFVDFTLRRDLAKVTKVREIKYKRKYEPAVDLWKAMREGIVELHKGGKVDTRGLNAITAAQTHDLKLRHYPIAAAGYLKFLGRRPQDFFPPPQGIWKAGDLEVKINPEVGLRINGHPTVIKLYFKSPPLTTPRVQASIGAMVAVLTNRADPETHFGVVDVKAGKLFGPDGRSSAADVQILIKAEARSFVEIWNSV